MSALAPRPVLLSTPRSVPSAPGSPPCPRPRRTRSHLCHCACWSFFLKGSSRRHQRGVLHHFSRVFVQTSPSPRGLVTLNSCLPTYVLYPGSQLPLGFYFSIGVCCHLYSFSMSALTNYRKCSSSNNTSVSPCSSVVQKADAGPGGGYSRGVSKTLEENPSACLFQVLETAQIPRGPFSIFKAVFRLCPFSGNHICLQTLFSCLPLLLLRTLVDTLGPIRRIQPESSP